MACYVTNTTADDSRGSAKCVVPLEDYLECLHHNKEAHRTRALQAAYRKKMKDEPPEKVPTAKEIRSLGLLDGPIEGKHLTAWKWLRPADMEPVAKETKEA